MSIQVCRNGHVTNINPEINIDLNKNFCAKCGETTLQECPKCHLPIESEGYLRVVVPNYCNNCGQPFPWTETRLEATRGLIQEQSRLSQEDRQTLDNSLSDLVKDTPKTTIAAMKAKAILDKAGPVAASMFRDILVDVVSETAKKILFPK